MEPIQNHHRHRALLEFWDEKGRGIHRELCYVLGKAPRTIFNYREGVTALSLEQCVKLAIHFDHPEFVTAWFRDYPASYSLRPVFDLEGQVLTESFFQAQMLTEHSVDDLLRYLEEAAVDGYDSTEIRKVQRLFERAVNLMAQLVLPVLEKDEVLI